MTKTWQTEEVASLLRTGGSAALFFRGEHSARLLYPSVKELLASWVEPSADRAPSGHVSNVVEEEYFAVPNVFGVAVIEDGKLVGVEYGWQGNLPHPEGHQEFGEGGPGYSRHLHNAGILPASVDIEELCCIHYAAVETPGIGVGTKLFQILLENLDDKFLCADLQPGSVAERLSQRFGFAPTAVTVENLEGEGGAASETWYVALRIPVGYVATTVGGTITKVLPYIE